MNITINQVSHEIAPDSTVADIACKFLKDNMGVVIELNGKIIAKAKWEQSQLSENDAMEFIQFVGGG